MIFEFLIFYRKESGINIRKILSDTLTRVLEDNFNEFDPEEVQQMVILCNKRLGKQPVDEA